MPKIKLTPEAVTLRNQGWTQQRIAEHFGAARNTVSQYLRDRDRGRPARFAPELRLCACCDAPIQVTAGRRLAVNSYCSQACYYKAVKTFPYIRCVYSTRLAPDRPQVFADEDLVKGVLTNLLENAAQAVSPGGTVLGVTISAGDKITIEVHDSGPGVSLQARSSLFQPAISFKRGGMGLGLSIARKSALLAGGDIQLVPGELGGAAFRVLLPVA